MGLYERILGIDATNPKVPIHQLQAAMAEWARGNITGAQANAIIAAASGAPLTPAEVTEATTLVGTVPTGGTTANQAARALRLLEIDQVLLIADLKAPPYDTAQAIKTRLGV